jgi:hypothetical protein
MAWKGLKFQVLTGERMREDRQSKPPVSFHGLRLLFQGAPRSFALLYSTQTQRAAVFLPIFLCQELPGSINIAMHRQSL